MWRRARKEETGKDLQDFGYFSFSEDKPIATGPRNNFYIYRHGACWYFESGNERCWTRKTSNKWGYAWLFASFCRLILVQVQPVKRHLRCQEGWKHGYERTWTKKMLDHVSGYIANQQDRHSWDLACWWGQWSCLKKLNPTLRLVHWDAFLAFLRAFVLKKFLGEHAPGPL